MSLQKHKTNPITIKSLAILCSTSFLLFLPLFCPHFTYWASNHKLEIWPIILYGSPAVCTNSSVSRELAKCLKECLMYQLPVKWKKTSSETCIYDSFWMLSPAAHRAAWNWRAYRLCSSLSLSKSSWNVGREAGSLVEMGKFVSQHEILDKIEHN